jgi:hypothetical protein
MSMKSKITRSMYTSFLPKHVNVSPRIDHGSVGADSALTTVTTGLYHRVAVTSVNKVAVDGGTLHLGGLAIGHQTDTAIRTIIYFLSHGDTSCE